MKKFDMVNYEMRDYYLQSLVDFYWKEEDREQARFDCFEFLIQEYRLDHISIEEFNMLFNLTLLIGKFYDLEKNDR